LFNYYKGEIAWCHGVFVGAGVGRGRREHFILQLEFGEVTRASRRQDSKHYCGLILDFLVFLL